MSKGSARRPGDQKAFAEGWDRIFGKDIKIKEESLETVPVSDVITSELFAKNIVATERSSNKESESVPLLQEVDNG